MCCAERNSGFSNRPLLPYFKLQSCVHFVLAVFRANTRIARLNTSQSVNPGATEFNSGTCGAPFWLQLVNWRDI